MTRNFPVWPVLLILLVISLPLVIMYGYLALGTVTTTEPGELLPSGVTLENWRFLFDSSTAAGNIWAATFNTFVFAGSITLIVLTVSATGGYAVSRLNLPFRRFFLASILVMHAFPSVTLIIGVFLVLQFTGLYDTMIGVIAVKASLMLPFGIWIMKGFYDTVPWEIEMAGVQDGASRLTVWWRLLLPQVRPGLVALGLFAFLDGWGEYVLPRILAPTNDFRVLSIVLDLVGNPDRANYDFNLFKTVGVFYTLPVLVIFAFFQHRLMDIFGGGTKG
ncbi:carbohydrate ABC transporter permease [Oricola thermophila]|uniref:Maltose/maltodextrin transport system permease protein MalG n=1 Tax=Oricola thermophila TaxID=2742145 RepID=A0A6N1VCA7_9HYPH|nr:carbohydrate ABC transporter permease [Oricola thermophila]QKV17175.1 carbohydrate ABC transporter permease [Oricola thermophila]